MGQHNESDNDRDDLEEEGQELLDADDYDYSRSDDQWDTQEEKRA